MRAALPGLCGLVSKDGTRGAAYGRSFLWPRYNETGWDIRGFPGAVEE